ncbi:MAG: FHA domain-containing protein [Synechococcales bacterium]|nr:FHA domain-containing protein [Synechococcales bacterium]
MLIIEDNKGRREFTLDSPVYSIGRDPKCDIRLVSQFVSRRHATLVQLPKDDGGYYYRIVDGNLKGKASANGLIINGRKLQAHDLQDEDKIVFGPQVSATYYMLKREAISTVPPDEFDITLISPNMVGDPEDQSGEQSGDGEKEADHQDADEQLEDSSCDEALSADEVMAGRKLNSQYLAGYPGIADLDDEDSEYEDEDDEDLEEFEDLENEELEDPEGSGADGDDGDEKQDLAKEAAHDLPDEDWTDEDDDVEDEQQ